MTITKSDFLKYQECASYFWFYKNKPEVLSEEKIDPFIERLKMQGVEVEEFARGLYPDAELIKGKPEAAAKKTKKLIKDGTKEIFQASFLEDGLFAACDVLVWNELLQGWDIIEIKSSTSKHRKKKGHIMDAAFQRVIAMKAGLKVSNVYLVELSKTYVRKGEIDLGAIFDQSEITTECIKLEEYINGEIEVAKNLLTESAPKDCSCKYKGRSRHCRAFNHLYPEVPIYGIYDLRAIGNSPKVLTQLVDGGFMNIFEIPDEIKLNQLHKSQRWVNKSKKTVFRQGKIKEQFDNLEYPLYFLDYETLACGIPKYDQTFPYQQTVFQYSLHIMQKDGTVEHKEFIHQDDSTPVKLVPKKLREDIGDEGSVVVWNKSFEGKCNIDMSKVSNKKLSAFLIGLNDRTFDLMEIFRRMEYLTDDLQGSYSIKDVLPILCPDLSYSELEVSDGAQAVVEYENLIFGKVTAKKKKEKLKALLEYCKLDTWAMVRIFQELEKMVKEK